MRGAHRQRKPGRREPYRDPRPILLIVCEGKITEREYFEQFALHHQNSRVKIKVADDTGVPFSLVQAAKGYKRAAVKAARRERDENLKYDSVWCVFDIDEHPNVPEARNMASANDIQLAISNPCFELWLLLHLRDSPGMQNRHAVQKLLKTYIKDYDKHIRLVDLVSGYERAVDRARRLQDLANLIEPGCNPTTNVYELTESILKDDEADPNPKTPPDDRLKP
jgi:hypothetical protein